MVKPTGQSGGMDFQYVQASAINLMILLNVLAGVAAFFILFGVRAPHQDVEWTGVG